jgi:D-alanyl-lipoteichoic acid acyltransferase DltB (MBOAT superfamily)
LLFPTLQFALFFLILLALLFVFRRSTPRKLILLVAGWVFYMAWNPAFIWLLFAASLIDYWAGGQIHRLADPRRRRALLVLSLCANLGLLGYFKYAGLLASSLLYLFKAAGVPLDWHLWAITLPVGISFYTFQSMSYTIDIYLRRAHPAASLLDYMLFVGFFPHLVAGPIVRAIDFLPQLQRPVQLRCDNKVLLLIASGLVKKVVVADNLAPLVNAVLRDPAQQTSPAVWLATLCFAVQIYCDFSGYTDIAIGLARLLGFWIPPNFDRPYFARNPGEFWRKWHISLSSWLRDYLYIPLGGNRGGEWRSVRNLMLTMLLGGLWHGASWNFVLWGAWHGLLLVGHRGYERLVGEAWRRRLGRLVAVRLLSWGLLQYGVLLGWLLFRLPQTPALLAGLHKFLVYDGSRSLSLPARLDKTLALGVLICFCVWHTLENYAGLKYRLEQAPRAAVYAFVVACMLLLAVFGPARSQPFIYFQF